MELTQQQKAINWFQERGIEAQAHEDSVLIQCLEYYVLVSNSEIEYRAELYDEQYNVTTNN